MLYQLSFLHAVLCGKTEESHACMPMKMEKLSVLRVLSVLRPNKIPTCIEHGRTKRTNVLRPNKIPTCIEHGRTKRTNVLRLNKIPTY